MEIILRQETEQDHQQVFEIIEQAFQNEEHSDQAEQFLVENLRKSDAFIPELSIVAEYEGEIVGHILLTKIVIQNGERVFDSLALAPVSVKPEFQNKGIGGRLVIKSHEVSKNLGYKSIILLGHDKYYPRFGYRLTKEFDIKLPFEAPDECCMAIELVDDGLSGVSGIVVYPKEFFE